LPRQISFDRGTVFFDNTTTSPFPTRLHLWLLSLGVEVSFTRVRRPTDHAHLPEHAARWNADHGTSLSAWTLGRALRRLGWSRKKSLRASERDE
jgi:hypothetical protein